MILPLAPTRPTAESATPVGDLSSIAPMNPSWHPPQSISRYELVILLHGMATHTRMLHGLNVPYRDQGIALSIPVLFEGGHLGQIQLSTRRMQQENILCESSQGHTISTYYKHTLLRKGTYVSPSACLVAQPRSHIVTNAPARLPIMSSYPAVVVLKLSCPHKQALSISCHP